MPKLPADWTFQGKQPFKGVDDPFFKFTSFLPSVGKLQLDAAAGLGISMPNEAQKSWANYSVLTARTFFVNATSWGVPEFEVPAIGRALNNAPLVAATDIAKGVVTGNRLQIINGAIGVLSAIPVVGWVVGIAASVGRTVASIFTTYADARRDDKSNPRPAITYDRDADEDKCQDMLDTVQSGDWTNIFLPTGTSVVTEPLVWAQTGIPGTRVRMTGIGGFGVVPGIPEVTGMWQIGAYPPKVPDKYGRWQPFVIEVGDKPKYGAENFDSVGELLPSVTQYGNLLWGLVRKNSANAFRIDTDRVLRDWMDFYGELAEYIRAQINTHGQSQKTIDQRWNRAAALTRMNSVGTYVKRSFEEQFNASVMLRYEHPFFWSGVWGADAVGCHVWKQDTFNLTGFTNEVMCDLASRENQFVPSWAALYPGPGGPRSTNTVVNVLAGALVRFVMDNFTDALYNTFCRTITVAYVGPNFPALKNDLIRDRWDDSRKKLLTHQARYSVDLELIPDAEYRNALAKTLSPVGYDFPIKGPPKGHRVPPPLFEGVPLDIVPVPMPPRPPKKGMSTGAKVALAGGAALAFWQREAIGNFFRRGK